MAYVNVRVYGMKRETEGKAHTDNCTHTDRKECKREKSPRKPKVRIEGDVVSGALPVRTCSALFSNVC